MQGIETWVRTTDSKPTALPEFKTLSWHMLAVCFGEGLSHMRLNFLSHHMGIILCFTSSEVALIEGSIISHIIKKEYPLPIHQPHCRGVKMCGEEKHKTMKDTSISIS